MLIGDTLEGPGDPLVGTYYGGVLFPFIIAEEVFQIDFQNIRYGNKGVDRGGYLVPFNLGNQAFADSHLQGYLF